MVHPDFAYRPGGGWTSGSQYTSTRQKTANAIAIKRENSASFLVNFGISTAPDLRP